MAGMEPKPTVDPGAAVPLPDWAAPAARALAPARLAELAQVLQLLDGLAVDPPTRAAAIARRLDCWPRAEAVVPGCGALREGLAEAGLVWSLHADPAGAANAEGLRRLLLAIVRDLRVVFILLAEQLVALRQAARLAPEQRRELARLAADIHAPLANRLGIWQLKWELEDLAFRFLNPDTYRRIAGLLDERRGDRERYIQQAGRDLAGALEQAGVRAQVAGRPKHIFSIWKKMGRKNAGFGELYDVRAARAGRRRRRLLCRARGRPQPLDADPAGIRRLHRPAQGQQLPVAAHGGGRPRGQDRGSADPQPRDARPRRARRRRPLEVQGGRPRRCRARAQDRLVAQPAGEPRGRRGRPRALRGLPHRYRGGPRLRADAARRVVDLPAGATVLDFAYHVHTEVGHRCRGAKVNGRIVPLTHSPQSGDRIEILTGKEAAPRRDWLNAQAGYLVSGRARDKVRAWFRRLDLDQNLREGAALLERELKRLGLHEWPLAPLLARWNLKRVEEHVAVAFGEISPAQVARAIHEAQAPRPAPAEPPPRAGQAPAAADAVTVEGIGNLMLAYARCCQPLPGDAITGYVTQGRGVSVHRQDCGSFARMAARHPERVLPVEWGRKSVGQFEVGLRLRAFDRGGLLKDVTAVFAGLGVPVLALDSRIDAAQGEAEIRCAARVRDVDQLGTLLARLSALPSVREARRLT